jgi:hypothetical protein
MPIKIHDDVMCPEIDETALATARRADGCWEVGYWPQFFDRDQAITTLITIELLDSSRDSNDPVVRAPREQLR